MAEVIKFYCPCGQKLGVPRESIGLGALCPRCNRTLRVPAASLPRDIPAAEYLPLVGAAPPAAAPPPGAEAAPSALAPPLSLPPPVPAPALVPADEAPPLMPGADPGRTVGAAPAAPAAPPGEAIVTAAPPGAAETIRFYCPCGQKLGVPGAAAGFVAHCPQCARMLRIPAESRPKELPADEYVKPPTLPVGPKSSAPATARAGAEVLPGDAPPPPAPQGTSPAAPAEAPPAPASPASPALDPPAAAPSECAADVPTAPAPAEPAVVAEPSRPARDGAGPRRASTKSTAHLGQGGHSPSSAVPAGSFGVTIRLGPTAAILLPLAPGAAPAAAVAAPPPASAGGGASTAAPSPARATPRGFPAPAATATPRAFRTPSDVPILSGVPAPTTGSRLWAWAAGVGSLVVVAVVLSFTVGSGPRAGPAAVGPDARAPGPHPARPPRPPPPTRHDPPAPASVAEPRRREIDALLTEGRRREAEERQAGERHAVVHWRFEDASALPPPPDPARRTWVAVRVGVQNFGYPHLPLGPARFVYQSDGREYVPETADLPEGALATTTLADGARAGGVLLFRVPERAPRGALVYRPFEDGKEACVRYSRE